MKFRHTHRDNGMRRSITPLLVALALMSGSLVLGSSPAIAEGGGGSDQGVDWKAYRESDANSRRQYEANNGVGSYDRRQANNGQRDTRQSNDRSYRDQRSNRDQRSYRDQQRSYGRSYRPNNRSYAYADPYYAPYYGPPAYVYDPRPTPGISLFFGF